jgi:hypothetical protein
MTFRSVYNEEWGGFGPQRAPQTHPKRLPSVRKTKIHEVLFIDKIKRAARSGVRSNAEICVRTYFRMRSMFWCAYDRKCITALCAFVCRRWVRPQVRSNALCAVERK